jgi:hypothetical protein
MNIRQYTGGMKQSNIHAICSNLAIGFKNPKPRWEKSKIIRRGKRLENGDILWLENGRLYIERMGA